MVVGSLVRCTRAVVGVLKGHDAVTNLVLDECKEFVRGVCTCAVVLFVG